MFDKFFDCLNTRDLEEGMKKRKPDLNGYFSENDSRFKVHKQVIALPGQPSNIKMLPMPMPMIDS